MIKRQLEWLKRGMCIALAGVIIFSSDAVTYAAGTESAVAAESAAVAENTENPGTSEDAEEPGGNTEAADPTEDTESAEPGGNTEAADGTETPEPSENTENTENTESAESTEPTEPGENTDGTEPGGNTEAADGTETPEPSENTESTESTEPTESTEMPEPIGNTESTETSEDTEDVGDPGIRADKVAKGIVLAQNYTITDVGATMALPAYTITYEDPNAPGAAAEVVWTKVDDFGVITLDAEHDRIIPVRPGTAKVRVAIKNSTQYYAEYLVVVRPPEARNAKIASATYNSAVIGWDKAANADGYTIYRKAKSETDYKVLAHVDGADKTTYTDTGLAAGTEYAYRVYSYVKYTFADGKVNYAEAINPAVASVTPTVGTPVISGVKSVSASQLAVSWGSVDGAAGYTVYRAQGSSTSYKEIGNVGASVYSYTDGTAVCGVSYSYQVRAYSTVNGTRVYGAYSKAVSGKAVPGTTTVNVSVKNYEAVNVSWTKVAGVNGYAIYRKAGSDGSYKKIQTISSGSKVSYTDEMVDTGTKYYYKVRAYKTVDDETVWGAYSNEVSVTPTMKAPKVTLTNNSYNSVTVKWNKISGADGYKVTRAESADGAYKTVKTVKDYDIVSYKDTGLSVGKTYYYKVYAYRSMDDGNVKGAKSEAAAIKAVPGATTVKSEAAGATQIKLTWSKVSLPSKNSGYIVYQQVGGSWKKIKTCSNKTTSYTVKNLTVGTDYTFRVTAYAKSKSGQVAEGTPSNTLKASPKLLAAAMKSAVSNTYNSVKVTWSASKTADEDGYEVYRATSKKGKYKKVGTVSKKSGTDSYTYTDSGVKIGTKYYYKVICTKTVSGKTIKSGYSDIKSVTAAPGKPGISVKTTDSGKLKISWKAVKKSSSKNVDGYVVYRSTSKNGKYSKVKTISKGSTTSFTDSGLKNGKTYYYKVRAYVNVKGKKVYGEYSSVKSKKVIPGTPSIKAVSTNYKTVTVSWKKLSGCDGYEVYRSEAEDGAYKRVKTIKSGSTISYKDGKRKTGVTYYYKVRAYDTVGGKKVYGGYSKVKSATPVLGKPTKLAANVTQDGDIRLTWNAVDGAQTYTVLRSDSQNGKYKIATEICSTNSYVDTNVKAGKTYYYKVCAVRGEYKSDMTDCVTVMAASLTVSVESVVVKTGGHVKLSATAKPSSFVSWSTVDPTIAVVSSEGMVYGMKAGTTIVKASANGIVKEIPVTVKDKLDKKGIDLSSADGTVDFNAIAAAGYEFVILRVSDGSQKDSKFDTNYTNAKAAGLKVGAYCNAKATNIATAEAEANSVISYLGGRALDYPVIYRIDNIGFFYSGTAADRSRTVLAFRNKIIAAVSYTGTGAVNYGFALGVNKEWMMPATGAYFDMKILGNQYLWLTSYTDENLGPAYTGPGTVIMWRYTNQGTVGGVKNKCNMNISYWK